jgi:hypothetical protein
LHTHVAIKAGHELHVGVIEHWTLPQEASDGLDVVWVRYRPKDAQKGRHMIEIIFGRATDIERPLVAAAFARLQANPHKGNHVVDQSIRLIFV